MDDFLKPMRQLWYWCLLLCLLAVTPMAQAQEITLNGNVTGQIASGRTDDYTFSAVEGQVISFRVHATANLDPILTILDRSNTVLIRNDDFEYPASRDSLIEAFTAPYTGNYTLQVVGYGETTGQYDLSMVAGYNRIILNEQFDVQTAWRNVDMGAETRPVMNTSQTLSLSQSGIRQPAVVTGFNPTETRYFVRMPTNIINSNHGWQAGMVLRFQNSRNYYQVLLNQNGAWRMDIIENGTPRLLRDWTIHPAIRAGETQFVLGVLVNSTGYDIFYNDQYVGSVVDPTLTTGQIGVKIITADAIGSVVSAQFDNITITVPTLVNNAPIFPEMLVAASTNYTARELERRLVIPVGSTSLLTLAESSAQDNDLGVSRFPIASSINIQDVIVGTSLSWTASGSNACGLIVRYQEETGAYGLVYLDQSGGYGLAYFDGTRFTQSAYNQTIALGQQPYRIIVLAVDEALLLYINRQFALRLAIPASTGTIGEAVVNYEPSTTSCRFTNLWVSGWQ